jgi:hypothetical protein
MGQQFTEVDLECLIGKEWSLIGRSLRHETDGLWLKDPSAIDAAEWVDDAGKTHELWVHPTSTPTKPALPFPFTMAQFKMFCDWHPTFEWEAITSVFTNDDDTVDDKNLAFVDSRSRAAGALVRYIIGKTDEEFEKAWEQHCAVDAVEAKIVELVALKPDKISEIQYRDARLNELRSELARLKQGVSDSPVEQRPATPAPVASSNDRPLKHREKKPTIEIVAMEYMRKTYKNGQFQSATKFHKHLTQAVGATDSPFEMGTGINARKLFCPAASSFFDPGTLSKMWAKIRAG